MRPVQSSGQLEATTGLLVGQCTFLSFANTKRKFPRRHFVGNTLDTAVLSPFIVTKLLVETVILNRCAIILPLLSLQMHHSPLNHPSCGN